MHLGPVRSLLAGLALAQLAAPPAAAHMAIEGLGGFLNGVLHPVVVPAQLLLIIGFALLAGRRGYARVATVALGFCGGLVAGLLIASWPAFPRAAAEKGFELVQLGGAMIAGAALAAGLAPPSGALLPLAIAVGVVVGLDSGLDAAWSWGGIQVYAGTLLGSTLATLYLAAISAEIHARRPEWLRIGVRIAGSWITAIAIMIVSLTLLRR